MKNLFVNISVYSSGGIGVKKGIDAKEDFDRAERIGRRAKRNHEDAIESLESEREKTNQSFQDLGRLKVSIFSDQIKYLVDEIEQREAAFLSQVGELFNADTWSEPYTLTAVPAGMSTSAYIERWYQGERVKADGGDQSGEVVSQSQDDFSAASNRCQKHGKPYAYSDEMGGRYCSHVDCWERYRLIRAGAALGYPVLSGVIDPRTHLADTSKAPLYHTASGLAVYPCRPVIRQQLIAAGADAWREYVSKQAYHHIDRAVKAALDCA